MTIAILQFPGTNNEYDIFYTFNSILGHNAEIIPYFKFEALYDSKYKGICLPGGFSYGDYLRPGAIASVSKAIEVIKQKYKESQIPIFGICNGFQILTEAGLLPGVLLKNNTTKFVSKWVYLRPFYHKNPLTLDIKRPLYLPIAHFEGRYWVEDQSLEFIKNNNQILFQYSDSEGNSTEKVNPNGSLENIAGICNEDYKIFGMMPHPERASRPLLSSNDGLTILRNFVKIIEMKN